jgi:hypothetical protein
MPNCTSRNSGTRLPLWRAERLRLYRRQFSGPSERLKIRVRDENINCLARRGYLGPDELDDPQAISQAVRLFIWDALYGAPLQIASKGAKRSGSGKSPRSRKSISISRGAATT